MVKNKSLTPWLIVFLSAVIFLFAYVFFMNWHKEEIKSLENQNKELLKKIERLENSPEAILPKQTSFFTSSF